MRFVVPVLCLVATPAAADILFTDVAPRTGLGQGSYGSPSAHGLGVAWIDFDLDGLPDVFATNGYGTSGPHLFWNRGGDTFDRVDRLLPVMPDLDYVGVRRADYDGDGDPDLYVFTAHEYWNLGGLDNKLDGPPNVLLKNLFVENGFALSEPLFVNVADEAGVDDCPEVPYGLDYECRQSREAVFLDYDLDGCTDLFVGHMVMNLPGNEANRDRLYRSNCDGTFEDVTEQSFISSDPAKWRPTLASIAADFNGDMCPDIYMGTASANETLLEEDYNDVLMRNNCDGTFTEVLENQLDDTPAAMGTDISDMNGDGVWELYITDAMHDIIAHDPGNTLYSARAFGDNRAIDIGVDISNTWGTNFFDADNDGDEDLFVGIVSSVDFNPDYSHLFVKDGTTMTSLEEASGLDTKDVRGSATADYDGDGDVDLLVINQAGKLQLFCNDTTGAGGYLKVHLEATVSNPDAFGAVVTLTDGERNMIRQHLGGRSSDSHDDDAIHFGLGAPSARKRELEVRWPSGAVSTIEDPIGPEITVTEPR